MRDPQRIPILLAAIQREWRQHPDQRLGQRLVNLLRRHRSVPYKDEGRALFAIEDGEFLMWLGVETEDEQRYIEDERTMRRWGRGTHSEHRHTEQDDS